jgi:hypothetical protein
MIRSIQLQIGKQEKFRKYQREINKKIIEDLKLSENEAKRKPKKQKNCKRKLNKAKRKKVEGIEMKPNGRIFAIL